MNDFYGKKFFAATIVSCLVIAATFWTLYHLPTRREIVQINLQQQQTASEIVNILNFKNEHGDLDEYLESIEDQLKSSEIALPSALGQGEFINYLQIQAIAHKTRLISITPGTVERVEDHPQIVRLPIKIKIECTYFDLIGLLKSIEDSERLINIENFSITSMSGGTMLSCELQIVIFALEDVDE